MKKVLLIACSLIISSSMFAQTLIKENSPRYKDLGDWKETSTKQNIRRDASNGWYLPVNWASAASPNSSNFQSFVSLVFPDSTVWQFGNASSTDPTVVRRGVLDNSWGAIFDPTDQNIQFDANQLDYYTQHQSYTWDSLYMRFGYVRQVDSIDRGSGNELIVDTLIIRYYSFNSAGIEGGNLAGGSTYSRVRSYNTTLGYAPSNYDADTILLTNADSTTRTASGWRTTTMVMPVNRAVPAASNVLLNRLVGFTTHFKPEKPYAVGDTLLDLTDQQNIQIYNKNNYFVNSIFIDQNPQSDQVPSVDHFNNALRVTRASRYGAPAGQWVGYVPGNAFYQNNYLNCGFHISTQNLSAKGLAAVGAEVGSVYPNPAKEGSVAIPVTLKESADVIVAVTDINGKVVYNTTQHISGTENVVVNIDNFATGIYNVNLNINGVSVTKKLMVK